jgi:pyruvate kinase
VARSRKTKIIATLGPAVANPEAISRLVAAGVDVARLNFSHGSYDAHREFAEWVRRASTEHGRPVALLQDIQGPRIRVGTFPGEAVRLEEGAIVSLVPGEDEGTSERIHVAGLEAAPLVEGSLVLLSDGLIVLEVTGFGEETVQARVVVGGVLRGHKGAAFPGVALDIPAITGKDERDLEFGSELGVDLIAASFVTSGDEIRRVKDLSGDKPVVAKIESVIAYENLDDILSVADGAMVARGDLGVEMSLAKLPLVQKDILLRTNMVGCISITATEMLESMTHAPRPTRAEVTDVANAVLDGSDAVMLSAETAIGQFPFKAVEAMDATCRNVESDPRYRSQRGRIDDTDAPFATAIARSAVGAAESLGIETIVAFTESGNTARLLSKFGPSARIVAFTPETATYRRMALYSGVAAVMIDRLESTDDMIELASTALLERDLAASGEPVVIVAGVPPNVRASTNLIKLHIVGSESGVSGRVREE